MSADTQIIDGQGFSRSVELVGAPQLSNTPGVQKISIQGSQRNVTIDLIQDVTSLFIRSEHFMLPSIHMCPRVGTAYTCPIPNVDKYWKYNALDKDSGIEISINRYQFEKLPYNITFNEPPTCIAVREDFNDIYEVEAGDTFIHFKGQWESSSLSHAHQLIFISDSVLV